MKGTKIISPILVLVAFIAISWIGGRSLDAVSSTVLLTGPLSIAVYIAIVAFNAVIIAPASAIPIIPIATQLWGIIPTACMSIIGWTIGSMVAFTIARRFGRPYVEQLIGQNNLEKMERYVPKENLFLNVVLLRMILPVDILSYAIGTLSTMRFSSYTLATLIGVAPFAFVFSYAATLPLVYQLAAGIAITMLVIVLNVLHIHRAQLAHKNENGRLYRCPVCGMHYHDEATAEKCEAWCTEHKSCNIDIIAHAVENEKKENL